MDPPTRDISTVQGTPPPAPRSAVMRSALRAVLSSAGLLPLYFVAPLDGGTDPRTGWLLVLALVLYPRLLAWQVRSVARSQTPRLRAGLAVLTFYALAVYGGGRSTERGA